MCWNSNEDRRICRKAKLMNAKEEETELKLIYISFAD